MNRVSLALAEDGSWRQFWWHYLQMVIAMMVGMALTPLGRMLFEAAGAKDVYARSDVHILVMATAMTVGMTMWMLFRRHGWKPIVEMAAAMYVPFIALLPLLWTGVIDSVTLSMLGHLLMLPAMAGVMLLRPKEYMMRHGTHRYRQEVNPAQR